MRWLLPLLALAACAPQPLYRTTSDPLPVAQVDIGAYLGLWHEAARLPNRFERGCVYATALYAQREDGLISVTNACRTAQGGDRVARGRARTSGAPGEGKLEVSFFGPFWADYWVLERAPDYSWAIVGEPEGRYLWVLTRSESVTSEQRADLETRIRRLGYRPAELVWRAT